MYSIIFYVPESHLESVKTAMFDKGAGQIGNYDCCCWQTRGAGQFRALPGSQPFVGKENVIEQIEEYKVEMACAEEYIKEVVAALLESHPYETPAYSVLKVFTDF
ncbi:MAG: NGG1p interacting factor NIF3 [Proteobacteria bacterium]|nr:NGG1p interacting factor NIF3 [Pseudomonadota bacterium]